MIEVLVTYPTNISYEERSKKVLIVLFIVTSVIANGGFIAVLLKRLGRRIITQANSCIELSLALGSILHALFANIIFAFVYYDTISVNCTLFVLASNWKENCIPFVYGCGLIMLCVDSILRSNAVFCINSRLHQSVKYSIFCATLPWLLGILISCPLTLSDVEFEKHCDFKQSATKEVVVQCVIGILPAMCSIFASFTAWLFQECQSDDVFQKRVDNYYCERTEPRSENGNNPPATVTTINAPPLQPTDNGSNPTPAEQQHTDYHSEIVSEPDNYYSGISEPENQIPHLQVSSSSNTGSQKEHDFPFDSPVLLLSCIVFSFCAIPYHVLELYIVIIDREPVKDSPSLEYKLDTYEAVIILWFYWLFDLYHVFIPILWIMSRVINVFCYKVC